LELNKQFKQINKCFPNFIAFCNQKPVFLDILEHIFFLNFTFIFGQAGKLALLFAKKLKHFCFTFYFAFHLAFEILQEVTSWETCPSISIQIH
jgi:hypothetical protein